MNTIKILSAEETAVISFIPKSREHPVMGIAYQLRPGESFILSPADWNWKSKTPSALTARLNRHPHLRFSCRRLAGKEGWQIIRTDNSGTLPAYHYLASNKTTKTMARKEEVLRT